VEAARVVRGSRADSQGHRAVPCSPHVRALAYCRLEWLASISDKEIRARSIQALGSVKTISFPKQAPWKAEVLKQLLQFPSGKYDDAVDVFSLIGRGL
jgi:predicted phage terminase large subunit-like protein